MKIDISRLNLLEKDIEDWLYENPGALGTRLDDGPIARWIGRQYTLPSGIADLIGIRANKKLVVVEVKNVAINKAAVLQVCRYQNDLKHIVSNKVDYPFIHNWNEPVVEMMLVGTGIDNQTFTEALAVGVQVFEFSASVNLTINGLEWGHEHRDTITSHQDSIAGRPEWDIYGLTITQHIEGHRQQLSEEQDQLLEVIRAEALKYQAEYGQKTEEE